MIKVDRVYRYEMAKKISDVARHGSLLKQNIVKSAIMKKGINVLDVKSFLTFTNEFLKFWEEYGNNLSEMMMKSHGNINVRTWSYQNIKDFIYEKYDYASIIKFMNSIHSLVENGNPTVDEIGELYKDTISTAFDDMPDTVAGLLDTYLSSTEEFYLCKSDMMEAKMYDTVKTYRKTFNSNDRSVLYRAITKTIELLTDPNSISYIYTSNTKLFVSIINNIIEYMVYSISFYAMRIYLIGNYAYPYIDSNKYESISESAENDSLPVTNPIDFDSMQINIMTTADELKCRDYNYIRVNIDTFNAFVEAIGAVTLLSGQCLEYGRYVSLSDMNEKNIFAGKLIHNTLYNLILNKFNGISVFNKKTIEEMTQILKSSIVNNKIGMDGATTDRHEILHVINGAGDANTVKGCQTTAADLTKFNFVILTSIENSIKSMKTIIGDQVTPIDKTVLSISDRKNIHESIKLLEDMYKEISVAILQRARALEIKYNSLVADKSKDINKKFSLDIRPKTTSDAIPDTTRMPYDLMDLYTLPAFESMQLYHEYLSSLPMFENDLYFSEAFNIGSVVNEIKSFILSMWKRLGNFINNQKVKGAVKWVTDNEAKIRSMNIEGSLKKKVHPYPETRNDKTGIDIMKGIKNLRENLANINPEDPNLKVDEFITSLYPSADVQKWWDKDVKEGNQMYHNFIIFGIPADQVKPDVMPEVELTANNIKDIVLGFIDSVKSLNDTYKSLEQIKNDIERGTNKIQQAAVKETAADKQNQQNKSNDSVGSAEGNNNDQKNDQNANNTQQKTEADTDKLNPSGPDKIKALADGTKLAVNRLWVPIAGMIINSVVDQYKVIQDVFRTANGSSNNSNNQK